MKDGVSSPIDGRKHTEDGLEQASHMRNMLSQEMCAHTSSPSLTANEVRSFLRNNLERQQLSARSLSMMEFSLNQHSERDDATKEEAAMRSLVMHRLLPAAKQVAAAEHESSIASQASKSPSGALQSQLQQCERTQVAHRPKPRARRAPEGFTLPHLLHSRHHQGDSTPQSMRSCGLLCLGLKTASTRACRMVSASVSKKTTWPIHSSNNTKVADEGISVIASEMEGLITSKEALGGMIECERPTNIHVPYLSYPSSSPNSTCTQESPPRHAVKYDASFCRTGCPSSDGFMISGPDPPLNHSGQAQKPGSRCKNRKSKQSCQGNCLTAACVVTEGQDSGTGMIEEAVAESKTSSRDCVGTMKTNGHELASVSAYKSEWHDSSDEEDDETQFFDTTSGLNSVKSNASSNTFGSPGSDCEVSAFQGERVDDEVECVDALRRSVASTSEDKPVPSEGVDAKDKNLAQKTSSLSQRVGKGLKLDTHNKRAIALAKGHPCTNELKNEHQRARLQAESLSGWWRSSMDSMGGLHPSKVATISPVFPAKCQNSNTHNALGWPFGISTYQPSNKARSYYQARQDQCIQKYAVSGHMPSPLPPPPPTESWLGKAVTKNASKTSPLATLQQKEKLASARKKLGFVSGNLEAERRWEDVVKGSGGALASGAPEVLKGAA